MKKQQIAIVEWTDATMHGYEQLSRKDAAEELRLTDGVAVGLIVREDKTQITLAMDWFHVEDDFRTFSTYPKTGIRRITRQTLEPTARKKLDEIGRLKPARRSK